MYTTALRILRSSDLASECVHDVLLRLWRRGDAYAPARGDLEAFLVTCARNEALARVRADSRRERILAGVAPQTEARFDPDPVERDRIAAAIAGLTPAQTQMIRLAYYRCMTHSEIARELNEPLGTVKSRLAGALRALRSVLVEERVDA